jgi:hypothetical protein
VEDAARRLDAEAFGNGVQDLSDPGGWGADPVEVSVTSSREFAQAGLAVEILDGILPTVVSVTDQSMDSRISNVAIVAVGVGAGLAARVDRFLAERPAVAVLATPLIRLHFRPTLAYVALNPSSLRACVPASSL